MEYVRLGKTGLKVSRICLGCMSYGDAKRGRHAWVLEEEASRPFIRQALDAGINFFDTANTYSNGASEEILGRALRDFAKRDEIVIASKVFVTMNPQDPNSGGLSRKAIFREAEASLKRLGTDYLDLYQIHRWDNETPIEETLEALHDLVKAGKTRYIGASSMHAWQFAKALYLADRHGWTRFVSMQPHYNLIYREEEREMLALCRAEEIGVIPWSPLARGLLARPAAEHTSADTARARNDAFSKQLYQASADADQEILVRVSELALRHQLPEAQISLAWMLSKPGITAPIIGATKPKHIEDAVAALAVRLSSAEITYLEAPYVPHPLAGFS